MARGFDRSGLIVFLTAIYVCSSLSSPSLANSADYANQDSVPPTDTWKESKPLLPLSGQARNATVRSGVTSFFRVPSTCGAASGAAGGGEGRGAGAAAGWNTGVGGSGGDARWYVNVEIWGLFAPGNDTSVFYLPMLMLNSAGEVPTVLVTNTLQYRLDDHTSIDYPNFRSGQPYQIVSVLQDDLVKNGSVNATGLIVGIFSDSYIAEGQDLGFSIRAFCSQGRGCPLNCSGRGVCGGGGVCQCPKGWGGTACADGETQGMGAGLRRMQVRMGVKVCGEGGRENAGREGQLHSTVYRPSSPSSPFRSLHCRRCPTCSHQMRACIPSTHQMRACIPSTHQMRACIPSTSQSTVAILLFLSIVCAAHPISPHLTPSHPISPITPLHPFSPLFTPFHSFSPIVTPSYPSVVHDIQPGLQTLAPGQWAFFQIEPLDDMTFESTQKSLPSLSSVSCYSLPTSPVLPSLHPLFLSLLALFALPPPLPEVTQPSTKLLIQMKRAAGDLVLFAKRQEQGFLPFGMPTVFDFNGFADMDSFRHHLPAASHSWLPFLLTPASLPSPFPPLLRPPVPPLPPFLPQVTQPSAKLLIQMERAAGDLVLFAKRQEQGFLPFGMPTVFDFNGFADMDSFRQRLDRHQIVWNRTEPGIVLVAVLNNDVDLRETGGFRLEYRLAVGREGRALCPWDCGWPAGFCQALTADGGGGGGGGGVGGAETQETGGFRLEYRLAVGREGRALCPWDCGWPAGFCQALAVDGGGGGGGGGGDGGAETQCVCNPDSAGSFCQGGLQTAELGKAVKGVLPPGRWTYVQFTFDPTTNKQIVISFTRKGGQASLVARQGAVPSLLENDYRFTVRVMNDTLVSLFDVVNSSREGPYTFGIFNLNYHVHQSCEFELEFKYKDSPSFFDSPYIIIIYAVLAFLLLVLIVIVLRCVIRRPPPAAADVELSALGDMDRHVEAVPTGVDRALVESFPLVKFRDDLFESSDDAHCAVCLADYDEQESLRKLPACSHYFFILIPLPLCAPPSPPFSPSPRSCAVCLADYDEQESLRKLPACSHYFHVSCIGEWLRTRCSCPLCRRYVLLQPPQPQQPEQPQQAAQPSALQAEQAGPLTQPTQAEQNSRRCAEEGQSEQLLPTQLGQSNERSEEEESEHGEEEQVAEQGQNAHSHGLIKGSEIIQGAGEDCAVQRNGCGGVVSAKEQQGEAQVDLKQRLQENHQQRHEEQVDGERDGQWHEEERLMKREGEEGMKQEACEGENDVIYNPEPALEGLLERDGRQHGERHGEVNADRAEHACISRMP
ncbi:unnamed protein product [Closterium sp. Naga37s-1]|nr:unnamed protein product [Closterium sp. Naga37s-1]